MPKRKQTKAAAASETTTTVCAPPAQPAADQRGPAIKRKRRCTLPPKRFLAAQADPSKPSMIALPDPTVETTGAPPERKMNFVPVHVVLEELGCCWGNCDHVAQGNIQLGQHVAEHLIADDGHVCLWRGCTACGVHHRNKNWLNRHIQLHTGMKAHVCYMLGCCQSFDAAKELERHINMAHFVGRATARAAAPSAPKPVRASKAARERALLQPPLSWELTRKLGGELARLGDPVNLDVTKGTMTLTGLVAATRRTTNGAKEMLLRWFPQGIAANKWVTENCQNGDGNDPAAMTVDGKWVLSVPFDHVHATRHARATAQSQHSHSTAIA